MAACYFQAICYLASTTAFVFGVDVVSGIAVLCHCCCYFSSSASTSADITLLSQGESSDLRTVFNVYVTLVSTAWQSTPSLSESSRKLLAMRHVGSEVVDATIISGSKILVMPAKRSSCSWIQGRKAASGEGGGGASWQGDMPGGWLPI